MDKKITIVSQEQLRKLISEEATRFKKELNLKKEREAVFAQLKEFCSEDELKELINYNSKNDKK